jgi:2,3,4,5-tetrahydropyridine-2-carboxylate N-succinyltransferase
VKKKDSEWHVNQWLKKAILLSFRIQDMELIDNGPTVKGGNTSWWDKVPSKFQNWTDVDFKMLVFALFLIVLFVVPHLLLKVPF